MMKICSAAWLLLLPLLFVKQTAAAGEGAATVVVCYAGGSVSQADANAAMSSMLRVVERVGRWPQNRFSSAFTVSSVECRKLLDQKKPAFAITPLGVYLDRRAASHWVPLVQPKINGRTSERYRVVVRKGTFNQLAALKGHTLGGTVLDDAEFIKRIVFAGHPEVASFDLRSSNQAVRTLRTLDRGELDAVLLNEQQFDSLGALGLTNPIDAIFTSDDIPLIGVVADSRSSSVEERTRFAQALESMCSDAEGKKLCELFGVQAFLPVDPKVYDRVTQLWGRGN